MPPYSCHSISSSGMPILVTKETQKRISFERILFFIILFLFEWLFLYMVIYIIIFS